MRYQHTNHKVGHIVASTYSQSNMMSTHYISNGANNFIYHLGWLFGIPLPSKPKMTMIILSHSYRSNFASILILNILSFKASRPKRAAVGIDTNRCTQYPLPTLQSQPKKSANTMLLAFCGTHMLIQKRKLLREPSNATLCLLNCFGVLCYWGYTTTSFWCRINFDDFGDPLRLPNLTLTVTLKCYPIMLYRPQ